MSRIAILSDIHGNLPALTAVLREVEVNGCGSVVFLGDIVGYGASPAECVELVREHGGCCVMGNHDAEVPRVVRRGGSFGDSDWRNCGYQAGLEHAAHCLDPRQLDWLASLPYQIRISGALIAHANLHEPRAFDYIFDSASAEPTLAVLRKGRTKIGFFGHTHEVGIFADHPETLEWLDPDRMRIPSDIACAVTVGSVGQSRHETDRSATWVIWEPDNRIVEFRRTEYDRFRAVKDIIDAGLPLESALRLLKDEELALLGR